MSSIASLVGTSTGALVGGGMSDVVSGSQIGQTVVDNNGLLDYIPSQTPQKPNQPLANQIAQDVSNGKKSILNKTDADYLYQINTDDNLGVDVNVSELGELEITGPRWEKMKDGKKGITARPVSRKIWAVTGTVTLVLRPDGSYGVSYDKYDFDIKKGLTNIPRNIETYLGEPKCIGEIGCKAFIIKFYGDVKPQNIKGLK